MLALIALLRGRDRSSGGLLGVATAVKMYAAVSLPLLARRARSRVGAATSFAAAFAVLVLPFFTLAPGGVGFSVWTQAKRHLQIESAGASLLLVGSKLGIHHVAWVAGKPGSVDLGGGAADAVALLSSLLSIALVLLVLAGVLAWPRHRRAARDHGGGGNRGLHDLRQGPLASVPDVAPTARPARARTEGPGRSGTFFVALALTWPEYSFGDDGLRNQDWSVWLLLVRNTFLVATFVLLYSQLRERAGPPGFPSLRLPAEPGPARDD